MYQIENSKLCFLDMKKISRRNGGDSVNNEYAGLKELYYKIRTNHKFTLKITGNNNLTTRGITTLEQLSATATKLILEILIQALKHYISRSLTIPTKQTSSKYSNQIGHLPNLIKVFAGCASP